MIKKHKIDEILDKATEQIGQLTVNEITYLLDSEENRESVELICTVAQKLKEHVLGKVIYLPVPLYVGNVCINNCVYCGFRKDNKNIVRKTLTDAELRKKVTELISHGFRMIELVYGESYNIQTIKRHVQITKALIEKAGGGEVILNSAPFPISKDYKFLNKAGTDVVVEWMETEDREKYTELHPGDTPKSNYVLRKQCYDKMLKGGMKNVGIGILFGLANWKKDVLTLIQHTRYLEKNYKVAPIIGIPRLKPAIGAPYFSDKKYGYNKYKINDEQLKLIVAVYRLAMPYSQIFISTREMPKLMFELLEKCGGGNLFATECSVEVGAKHDVGYKSLTSENGRYGQFEVYSLDIKDVIKRLNKNGLIPSFIPPPRNEP